MNPTSTRSDHAGVLTARQRHDRTARALAASGTTKSPERRRQLVEYVIRINMEVSRSVASRYFNRGIEDDDLVQVAHAALTRAAWNYDTTRDEDFLSYAVPTIRGELRKHFRDKGWSVRPPRRIQELQGRVTIADGELSQQLGRAPAYDDIAAYLGEDIEEIREAMAANGCFAPTSLDRPLAAHGGGQGSATVADMYVADDAGPAAVEARVVLAPVLRQLKERDRRILYLRFFEQRTQQEIAEDIGVTQMQISRLLTRIFRDLRRGIEGAETTSPRVA